MSVQLVRRPFTVEEFHRMAEAGILHEDDRVELIEGEIVQMAAIGSRHANTVAALNKLLVMAVGDRAMVWVQNPIRLDHRSEPQPDISLVRFRSGGYPDAHPGPTDVLLVIEVADATLATDRHVKVPLYARHGIPEVWVVDLDGRKVEVYRRPAADGYADQRQAGPGQTLEPAALPGLQIRVDEIFPRP